MAASRRGNVFGAMTGDVAFGVLTGLVAATSGALLPRVLRQLNAMKAEESARAWRNLPAARKKAIAARLRRGLPVEDPDDAGLALDLVERVQRVRRIQRPIELVYVPLLAGFAVVGWLSDDLGFLRWFGIVPLVVAGALWPFAAHRRRRLEQSADATRRLSDVR